MADEKSLRARDVALAAGLSQRPPAVDPENRRSQAVSSLLRMFGQISRSASPSASGFNGGSSADDAVPADKDSIAQNPTAFIQPMPLLAPTMSDSHPIMLNMPLLISPGVPPAKIFSNDSRRELDPRIFKPADLSSSTGEFTPEADSDSTDSLPFVSASGNSSVSPLSGAGASSTEQLSDDRRSESASNPDGDSMSLENSPITVLPTEILVDKLTAAAIERAAALAEKAAEMAIDRLREEIFVSQSTRSASFPR
jgi:hypothetical protein